MFIPLLLMGGMVGVLFREFAVTVTAAMIMSAFVSLTLTPVMCAHFLRHAGPAKQRGRLDQLCEDAFAAMLRVYERGLVWVLAHQPLALAATIALAILTGWLYVTIPKGLFPQQDTGFLFGQAEAREDISFALMAERQNQLAAIVLEDPAVFSVSGFAGTSAFNPSENVARIYIQLKPFSQRDVTAAQVIERLRPKVARVPGVRLYLQAAQDLTFGGRLTRTQYQYTLTSTDQALLNHWAPILEQRLRGVRQIQDVATDQQITSRHLAVEVDRDTASRLGVSLSAVDQTLYDAFGEREVATIYSSTTQYKVLLEAEADFAHDPAALSRLYISGANGMQVPLSTVASFVNKVSPLTINHQGVFPAVTLSFNLAPGVALSQAVEQIDEIRRELKVPFNVQGAFQGTAQIFQNSLASTPYLIAAAILAVYIVLGMLYESYVHPITILSALPSAGVGALLALMLFGYDLSVIALIGIILLIGIVKKNAIMMIDFALDGRARASGKSPRRGDPRGLPAALPADHDDDLRRHRRRPAAGAGPGAGSELRQPLGIAIVGGLLVSQWLTLYTTPVVYLYLDRLSRRLRSRRPAARPPPNEARLAGRQAERLGKRALDHLGRITRPACDQY